MPTVGESAGAGTPQNNMASSLHAGLDVISLDQEITFQAYVRVVLPLDGYVFWVRMGGAAATPSALYNVPQYNAVMYNQIGGSEEAAGVFIAEGSLHYSTQAFQAEDHSSSTDRVVFTSKVPVQNLNAPGPEILYIATFDGPDGDTDPAPADTTAIRFAFSSRASHYQQAGLWHYIGQSVNPTMESQIVEDPNDLDTSILIVSNSLPAWLGYNVYNPVWPVPIPRPDIVFYPSFAVPENLVAPYGVIHIVPAETEVWQTMPRLGVRSEQLSLAKDQVQITLYGCNNRVASDLLYSILQYSFDTEIFGILNIPAIRDEKEAQVELHTLAQKKRIIFEVSYGHGTMRDIARQLITSCIPTVRVGDEIIFQPRS
jgi:hypothetical protein